MPTKHCGHCQHYHPKETFVRILTGKYKEKTMIMCRSCAESRKKPEDFKARLEALQATRKPAAGKAVSSY